MIFPASHYVVAQEKAKVALTHIERDLEDEVRAFRDNGKLLEAQRLQQRTAYDIEMINEIGFCKGIENYSRYFDGRKPGEPPFTLMDYFPDNFLVMIDESHMTIPQIRAMYHGDLSRKTNLVNYGFRLKSAYDNRPLTFEEFNEKLPQLICVSATPAEYELQRAGQVVEQLIRPTGLLDPDGGSASHQRADRRCARGNPQGGFRKGQGAHHHAHQEDGGEPDGISQRKRREGALYAQRYRHARTHRHRQRVCATANSTCSCGINLLREGLDLPEVKLVAILDADKEGFLRSETAFIQTIGRAARNAEGRVIMYADKMTGSMKRAIDETEPPPQDSERIQPRTRHRAEDHHQKGGEHASTSPRRQTRTTDISARRIIPAEIEKLKALMKVASDQPRFRKVRSKSRETISQAQGED